MQNPTQREIQFEKARASDAGQLVVDVMCSGRSGVFGLMEEYHQPRFLLVEFPGNDGESKSFASYLIPEGRGSRSMSIRIP